MELHVVFNYSAGASLREAFGPDVAIARFSDDLSYGPVDPPDPAIRRMWVEENLGFDNSDIMDDEDTFWAKVFAKDVQRIAWVSRRSAQEYCGFLEYVRRLGDLPTQIVDTTDVKRPDGEFFWGTAHIPSNQIISNSLRAMVCPIGLQFRSDCLALWDSLRAENGGLRLLDRNGGLVSGPISFYDLALLSLAGDDWQPMLRVVVGMLNNEWVSDLFLISRLYDLIDNGLLASRERAGQNYPDVKRLHR